MVSTTLSSESDAFFGEATKPMLTGSEEPSNQLARFSTFFPLLDLPCDCSTSSTENSAASAGDGRLGEEDLEELRKGRKVDDRVGEWDGLLDSSGGTSTVVRDRACPREDAGGGNLGIELSSKCSFDGHEG